MVSAGTPHRALPFSYDADALPDGASVVPVRLFADGAEWSGWLYRPAGLWPATVV